MMFSKATSERARALPPRLARASSEWARAPSSATAMASEDRFCARTYAPLPFVIARARGCTTWSPEGVPRLDFLAAFSAVNQGHCHPRLLRAMSRQAARVTLVSRAFHGDGLGEFARELTSAFAYERMLPANSGVEAWEAAMKLARRWAYRAKGVPDNKAVVLFPTGNFGGRSTGAISASTDPDSFAGFGPLLPGIAHVPFGDAGAVERALAADPNICAFFLEPVQGEAGVVLPPPGYLARVAAACRAAGVLLIADEVQTGMGRCGALAASWGEGAKGPGDAGAVRPDILVLGKALSGGLFPISAVLADDAIMLLIKPGEHGSTFAGSPLAAAVGAESLRVVVEEGLCANAVERGAQLRAGLERAVAAHPSLLARSRGVGLMSALDVRPDAADARGRTVSARDICLALGDAPERFGARVGVLAKPTHGHTIRLTPPLTIKKREVKQALDVLELVLARLAAGSGT
jgi:ornithine--oxo-acid transaminase